MKKPLPAKPSAGSRSSGKKAYQKPQLTHMGTVAKLTQSFTGSAGDFMGQFTKMM